MLEMFGKYEEYVIIALVALVTIYIVNNYLPDVKEAIGM